MYLYIGTIQLTTNHTTKKEITMETLTSVYTFY